MSADPLLRKIALAALIALGSTAAVLGDDYSTWASSCGVVGGPDDNTEGLSHFAEYAFGLDPTRSGALMPIVSPITQSGVFTYTRRRPALSDLTYAIQISSDLVIWTRDAGASQVAGSANAKDVETVVVRLTERPGTAKLFVRVCAGPPVLDPEAAAYQEATGITSVRASAISDFLTGLDDLGVRSSFVDGATYRADSQPASGTTAFSLRGLSNLTMTGSVIRHRNGLKFNNDDAATPSDPQYCNGTIPSTSGNVTLICADFRHYYASIVDSRNSVEIYRPANTSPWLENQIEIGQEGSNYIAHTFNGSVFASLGVPSHGPSDRRYRPTTIRNVTPGTTNSFSVAIPGQSTTSTAGQGSLNYTKMYLGACTNNGGDRAKYSDALVPYWLLFSKALTTDEETAVYALVDKCLHPVYRVVIEGDSMSSDSCGLALWMQDRMGYFGSNLDLVNVSAGGETSTQMVAELGGPSGINDSQMSSSFPVTCTIWGGQNDRSINGTQTHSNLRLLWAAAKSRGMQVVAFTITRSSSIDAAGWEADRQAANALIRADAGMGYYDYLMDADAFIASVTTVSPYYDDPSCYSLSDHVHLSNTDPGGNPQLLDALYNVMQAAIP